MAQRTARSENGTRARANGLPAERRTYDRRVADRRAFHPSKTDRRNPDRVAAAPELDRRRQDRRQVDRERGALRPLGTAPRPESPPGRALNRWGMVAALGLVGMLVGAGSLAAAYYLREGALVCGGGVCEAAQPYVALLPFAALVRASLLLRRRPWLNRRLAGFFDESMEAITDAAVGSVAIIVFTFLFRSGYEFRAFSYSRLVFVFDWVVATGLLLVVTAGFKTFLVRLRRRGRDQRDLVVVRDKQSGRWGGGLLAQLPEMGYNVVGTIELDHAGSGTGALQAELLRVVRDRKVDEVLLLLPRIDRGELSQVVGVAELAHLDIKAVPELFGLPPSKVSLDQMGNFPVMALLEDPLSGVRRAIKRTFDLIVASVLLVALSPLLALVALAVRVTSRGPILIKQTRVGMDGRPFTFLKFRSMYVNVDAAEHEEYVASLIRGEGGAASSEKPMFKIVDDPRVTRVGKILRRYSIDELPQLWNVVRGDMSLVGPRPSLPFEVSLYEDWHRMRLEVRPGMTGLWQIKGRSKLDFQEMVRLDIQYAARWSPLLDLMIILRTIPAVLRNETG
ncbi:MAG: sugar transferase [Actinomycetota bacterium]|nr:sugar transferase [Actinomycetota bacterium]